MPKSLRARPYQRPQPLRVMNPRILEMSQRNGTMRRTILTRTTQMGKLLTKHITISLDHIYQLVRAGIDQCRLLK